MIPKSKIFLILFTLSLSSQPQIISGADGEVRIGRVKVLGIKDFSESKVRSWFDLKAGWVYSRPALKTASLKALRHFRSQGYYFASVDSIVSRFPSDSVFVDLEIYMSPGKIVKVKQISIDAAGDSVLDDIFTTRAGMVFDDQLFQKDISDIMADYGARGYPYCQVQIDKFRFSETDDRLDLELTLKIEPGPQIRISEIEVRGNEQTKDYVIGREIRLEPGSLYRENRVIQIPTLLRELGYFNWVNPPFLELHDDNQAKLIIELEEGRYNQFNGVIGYNPGGVNSKGFVTGLIDLSFGNLLGTGRSIHAHWQRKTEKTQDLQIRYREPWIAGLPLHASVRFEQLIQDTIYVDRTVGLDLKYGVSRSLSVGMHVERRTVSPDSFGVLLFGIPKSNSLSFGIGASFNTLDDPFNPQKGIHYGTFFKWSRKSVDQAVPATEDISSFDQKRISIDFEHYFSLFRWQVIAVLIHGRQITSDEPEVPITEQYRLGGTQTLRGYREQQFRGSRIAWGSMEYRYLLDRRSRIFAFVDIGYFSRQDRFGAEKIEINRSKIGYGFGLRLETRLGYFGVDYGLAYGDGFSQGKIHIGLTNAF